MTDLGDGPRTKRPPPSSLNKYGYGSANPITYTDPSGYLSYTEIGVAIGIGLLILSFLLPPWFNSPRIVPLGVKMLTIYGYRLLRNTAVLAIGAAGGSVIGIGAAYGMAAVEPFKTYYLKDDQNQMTDTFGEHRLIKFYAREVIMAGGGPQWRTYSLDLAMGKGDPRDVEPDDDGRDGTKDRFLQMGNRGIGFWLGGAHGVRASGTFDGRIVNGTIEIRNVDVDWHWIDEVDARADSGSVFERAGDVVEKVVQPEYYIDVHWKHAQPNTKQVPEQRIYPIE